MTRRYTNICQPVQHLLTLYDGVRTRDACRNTTNQPQHFVGFFRSAIQTMERCREIRNYSLSLDRSCPPLSLI